MDGMMMDYPLTLQHFLERARRLFAHKEVVTRTEHGTERTTYGQIYERCGQLANALQRLGIGPGDRVGSFAWNTTRHLELYLGVPCSGRILHTANIRLSPEHIAFIITDAGDRALFVDRPLLPLIEAIRDRLTTVEHIIVLDGEPPPAGTLSYEALLAAEAPDFDWPQLDERSAAAICYSSGTTGNPKGVVYSHRALFLHSLGETGRDSMNLGESDTVMPVVPMFHANGWGMPYTAVAVGATLVMPGVAPTPTDLLQLIQDEGVTMSAGVPTVWIGALPLFQQGLYDFSSLNRILIGGSAVPQRLIEAYQKLGITIIQGWGMTETTPVATVSMLKSELQSLPPAEQYRYRAKQGIAVLGIEVKIVDDEGNDVPWDGKSYGEVVVRGPWVTSGYLHADSTASFTPDGWFRTGDVATIDPLGYVQIVDRTKDLVRSGGEWISSVQLESALMEHPDVVEAAVIAIPHEKWGERPLACVVVRPEARGRLTEQDLIEYIRPRFASWWLPDHVVFIDEVPKTSVGKFDKKALRAQFSTHSAQRI
jgi:fatty-acyl-CoA synthase